MDKLLDCPWCNGQPRTGFASASVPGMEDCGYGFAECCDVHIHRDTEAEAITAWNIRTPAATVVGWRPIETAPKNGMVIDLWVPAFGRLTNEWFDTEDNSWCFPGKPTHWMPIPAPPAGDG